MEAKLTVDIEKIKSHFINYGVILGEYSPGRHSRIMLDPRQALLSGGILSDVGELMWEKIKKYNPTVIYGTGFGSINLLLATQIAAEKDGVNLKSLVSRKKRKDTNMRRLVEGPRPKKGEKAVFIDDNMNSGSSYRQALKDFNEENIELETVAVALLYDFWTFNGSRRLELLGTPVERIFTRHDIGDTRIDRVPDLTKEIAWRSLSSNQWNFGWSNTSPLIIGSKVYFGNDKHEVFCHDVRNGTILWKYTGHKPQQDKGLGAGISFSNGALYFSSYDGTLTKLNSITGELFWKKHLDMFVHSIPFIDESNGQVYIGTEGGIKNKRGDIICLDLFDGRTKWIVETSDVIPASPMAFNNKVFCGSNDGYLYCIDALSGKLLWKLLTGVIKGRPNYIDDTIIVSTQNGQVYGLSEDGKILWNKTSGKHSHHQLVSVHKDAGLAFFVNSDGMAVAFNKYGRQVWIRRLRGDGFWNLTVRGNEIIIITINGHAIQLDPYTGKKIRSNWIDCKVRCACDFTDEFIAVNSVSKGFYMFRRNNGSISN